ncbi:MAG: hypothetical protein Q9M92_15010 [Enterobacterales bacterium]|nr:hypothetical protein [Enterobacterales bacterium]
MKKLSILLKLIGTIQIILGALYLFVPALLLKNIGHSIPPADIFYPLGMLAARFIAYGAAFIYIARDPMKYVLWIKFMILIQLIDLAAGIFYTMTGVVNIADSAFPMFNATWMIILLYFWTPKEESSETVNS